MTRLAGSHSEQLLERVAEVSLDGLMIFDRDCRYVLWNAVMEQIFGLPAEDVLGKRAFEVLPFLLETGQDRLFREALAGRAARAEDCPFHFEASHLNGYYQAYYAPWRSPTGEVIGGIAIVRDITERKRAAQQLAETENRFKNMADASPVLLWMSCADALCTFFNQTWLDFTGRTLEEEWGVGWAEAVHFEDFQRCMDTYLDAFNRREVFQMEYRLRRKDGEFRWVLDCGTPRYLPDGTFAGFIGSCIDITERKQLEEELRQAVRSRDEFLSIASHELRTPLTTLQLQLEHLIRILLKPSDDFAGNGRIEKSASTALEKTLHLGKMVNVLLDVSRISEGRLALEYGEFDLNELAQEVVERLKAPAADAGCAIELRTEARLVGTWDRFRLEQVLTNLISNAIKYGAGKPVQLSVAQSGATVRIRVVDQGVGLSAEQQGHIFDRFVRFAPSHYGGFGLGLWITRQIVDLHGGKISVHSRPGEGATFEVELPVQPACTDADVPDLHRADLNSLDRPAVDLER